MTPNRQPSRTLEARITERLVYSDLKIQALLDAGKCFSYSRVGYIKRDCPGVAEIDGDSEDGGAETSTAPSKN